MNYYNEHDRDAAAWLRELIRAGLIPDGVIDERDIQDVKASELSGFTQCHFFAGIGGWSEALRLAGWPTDRSVWTGSCPCQPFSAAGKKKGTADARHLWPAFYRLIQECKPAVVFGEQVASALEWLDAVQDDMEAAGYAFGAADLCAASVGAPHIRQRLYFVAHASSERRQQNARRAPCDEAANGRAGWDGFEANRDYVAAGYDEDGGLADDHEGRREVEREARIYADGQCGNDVARRSEDGWLADNEGAEREFSGETRSRRSRSADGSAGFMLENATEDGRGSRAAYHSGQEGGSAFIDDGSNAGGLAVTGPQSEGRRLLGPEQGDGADRGGASGEPKRSGGTFWSDCDWLPCRDGKWRPVKPGIAPMVDGAKQRMVRGCDTSAPIDADNTSEARVMRLRGYGNAVCVQVAAEFIKASIG